MNLINFWGTAGKHHVIQREQDSPHQARNFAGKFFEVLTWKKEKKKDY